MSNWIEVLKTARTSMNSLQAMPTDHNIEESVEMRLIGDLYKISTQYSGIKILFNFQMAALGLYFMLKGCTQADSLVSTLKD